MDDSDQDFVDLSSRLQKRVRRKVGEGTKQAGEAPKSADKEQGNDGKVFAKDKVLLRMQQFKRAGPQRMELKIKKLSETAPGDGEVGKLGNLKSLERAVEDERETKELPRSIPEGGEEKKHPGNAAGEGNPEQNGESSETFSVSGKNIVQDDEALALQLQLELDREAAESRRVGLEDKGLYFCQICQRDLTHMTSEGRAQHLNRCLDESEESGPARPSSSVVPDCPICGKKFKSQKSRSAHLKRCSSEMGVSTATLLQAVHRQENENATSAMTEPVGTKRKGPSTTRLPSRKKARKKEPLDEETMVALALSSSMLEQEKEAQLRLQPGALMWKEDAGKNQKKRKKPAVPRPPPMLLVQDAEAAFTRLQERVSALLLRRRPQSPPTPPRAPCSLPGWTSRAPLWQRSSLLEESARHESDFFVPELKEFLTPWKSVKASSSTCRSPGLTAKSSPVSNSQSSLPRVLSQTTSSSSAPLTPGTEELPGGSQALRDLMELAEDGMTLTQCGYSSKVQQQVSGFIQDDPEEPAELSASGFLLEVAQNPSKDSLRRISGGAEGTEDRRSHRTSAEPPPPLQAARVQLLSDLSSMVNNPQLSDVQLQVDSGEVFHAHSFMVYARCPLLAEMVHESGFGVQEEDLPAAQRVLLGDVPGPAVLALLCFLYTASCSVPAALQPHVLELADRFDLQELQLLCRLPPEEEEQEDKEGVNQTDQLFEELLRSMWNEGEDEAADSDEAGEPGEEEEQNPDQVGSYDREMCEEQVNEAELEEIYEFAATQRRTEERGSEEEQEDRGLTEPQRSCTDESELQPERVCVDAHPPPDGRLDSTRSWEPPEPSCDRVLESSGSVAETLPCSPLFCSLNLPISGHSPGQVSGRGDEGVGAACPDAPSAHKALGVPRPRSEKKEPELIVLSDSNEESPRASPPPPSPPDRKSFTQIRTQRDSTPAEERGSGSLDFGSPEVSWLSFSPVQPGRASRSNSTQTRSSMCRTQLFPRARSSASSPLSSPVFAPSLETNAALEKQDRTPLDSVVSPNHHAATKENSEKSWSSVSSRNESWRSFHLSPVVSPSPPPRSKSLHSLSSPRSSRDGQQRAETTHPEPAEPSPQHSFLDMDEPPIAYDSWGLDVSGGADPAGFSLTLQVSSESSRPGGGGSSSSPAPVLLSPTPAARGAIPHAPPAPPATPEVEGALLDSKIWDSWEEDDAETDRPLSQRVKNTPLYKTPTTPAPRRPTGQRRPAGLQPITPMPHYSDMDTPELKDKLSRFGVRALPKRQMVLKLKEIHQYTHQLTSSDSEDEAPPPPSKHTKKFKEPVAPAAVAAPRPPRGKAQSSSTPSATGSEESERSNQEFVHLSSDSDSDDVAVSSSQAAERLQEQLRAVRSFILSTPELYGRILQYRPLVLTQLQEQLKAAGIRLGAAKLVDYLDSQCITFTTAKPGQPAASRHRGRKAGPGAGRGKSVTAAP